MRAAFLTAAAFYSRSVPQQQRPQLVPSRSLTRSIMSSYSARSATTNRGGGSGRGRSFSRGRGGGRGRGRSGGRAGGGHGGRGRGRGRGGYDWTKHLPPDHPMRRGLGPDPSRSKSSSRRGNGLQGRMGDTHGAVAVAHAATSSQQSHDDSRIHADDEAWGLTASEAESDIIATEYAAYYQRREARRREQSERNRQQFDRVAAHASKRQEEHTPFVLAGNSDSRKFDSDDIGEDGVGAVALAARRAVLAMSDEEKEAAFARHEERQALSKYAVDLKPEGLHLSPVIRKELEKAVNQIQTVRDNAKQSSNCERTRKKIRSSSVGMKASYFKGKRSSNHDSNESYKDAVSKRMETRKYQSMLKQRRTLPAYQMSGSIADTILDSKVSTAVISGETGSGKT